MTVALAITPDVRWDAGTDELIVATAAAGFDALGIIAERAGADAAASYRAAGLGCHELLALLLGDDERDALAATERLADAAAAMGATWVLTAFLAPLSSRTETVIERCASTFAAAGAGMAVEFSPLGPVSTIPQALEILRLRTLPITDIVRRIHDTIAPYWR